MLINEGRVYIHIYQQLRFFSVQARVYGELCGSHTPVRYKPILIESHNLLDVQRQTFQNHDLPENRMSKHDPARTGKLKGDSTTFQSVKMAATLNEFRLSTQK